MIGFDDVVQVFVRPVFRVDRLRREAHANGG